MSTEAKKVNAAVRSGIVDLFPSVHWQRIECWQSKGVPDINFCLDGREYWVESKWVPSKRGKKFSHPLTVEQCAWLIARTRAGGSAWVLARREDTFRLYPGSEARSIIDNSWDGTYLYETSNKGWPWNWEKMLQLMKSYKG